MKQKIRRKSGLKKKLIREDSKERKKEEKIRLCCTLALERIRL